MAKSRDNITTKFSVDISELKAGIQEANRQIKLANSEFKKATAGMDDWSSSADGLTAKINQLSKVEAAEIKKLENLQQEYRLVAEEQGENSVAAQNLLVRLNNQEATVGKVQKQLNQYQSKLDEVKSSSTQANSATAELTNTISKQEAELNDLKSKYKDIVLSQGEASDEAQVLAAKITALNSDLQQNKSRLNEADNAAEKLTASLDKTETQTKDTGDGFTVMKGALSGLIANGISAGISKLGEFVTSLFEVAEATKEYRIMMNKVEGSANNFGYSIDYAKESYKEFYAYLQDDQMATNAINNLMGLQVNTETLDKLVNGSISTWTAYGDSIPIESLTESITETINVSKVTGTFADTINWASLSNEKWNSILSQSSAGQKAFNEALAQGLPVEDAFSAALAATTDKQTRANIVADALNATYGESKKTFDKLSGSILEANKAEAELKDTQAELAKTIEPINTEFTRIKNEALKALSPAIKEVAGEFTDLIHGIDWKGAAGTIGDLLTGAGKGLAFVLNNIKPITIGVKSLAAAWLTYKGVVLAATAAEKVGNAVKTVTSTITKALTTATVANTAATEGATVATKALSLAQKATPWGLVAGLITGAVVALGTYISKSKESTIETNKNTTATKEIANSYKELNEQLEQNKQTRAENLTSQEAEAASAEILLDRLDELAQKENKSNAEKALMKQYVDQLNEAMPELNLQYNEEKDALNMSTEAVRQQIQAQKDLVLAKAATAQLSEIASDMVKTELELSDATKQHAENEEALAEATEKAKTAKEDYAKGLTSYGDYKEALDAEKEAQANYDKTADTVEDLTSDLEDLKTEYGDTEDYATAHLNAAEVSKSMDSLVAAAKKKGIEIPQAISDGVKEGKYALPESVEELESLVSFEDLNKKAKDAGVEVPKTITKGIKSGELKPSEAVKQMQNLIDFNDLLADSTAAGQKVPENIKTQVLNGSMKPKDAVQYMKDLVTYNDMLQKAKDAGIKVPDNITSGVSQGKTKPADAVEQINSLMVSEANSTTGEMKSAGASNISNFKTGISGGASSVKTAAETVANQAVQAVKDKKSSAYTAGYNVSTGIGSGIRDGRGWAYDAITGMANSIIGIFTSIMSINSPSKVFRSIAGSIPEGIGDGIKRDAKLAIQPMKQLGNDLIAEGKRTMSGLNLSGVKGTLSGSLSSLKARVAGSNAALATAGSVNNITFNQYNTSPKAMDSLEVYRNTQKQLRQLKTLQERG